MSIGRPISLVALIILTVAAYSRIGEVSFHSIDDPSYILDNPNVLGGLTWDGSVWALTSLQGGMWIPLTWLSLMANVEFFGVQASAFHGVNLALHTINVLLLFFWLWKATGFYWRAFAVAGLFALHPQHVEAVIWAVERKEVLAAFFGLSTLICYWRYAIDKGNRWAYGGALLCYLLSVGSKPMWVSLPVLLLLFDFWPLDRIRQTSFRKLIIEKVPFGLIAGGMALATLFGTAATVTAAIGGGVEGHRAGLWERLLAIPVHYFRYLRDTFWPLDLSTYHPITPVTADSLAFITALLLLAAITLLAWMMRKREPAFITGWLWFLIAIFPVSGISQYGDQSVADRFTYLSHIGLFIAVVWPLARGVRSMTASRLAGVALAGLLLVGSLLSWIQTAYWRDGLTFWTQALRHYPGHPLLEFRLGHLLANDLGRPTEGVIHLKRAVEAAPTNVVFVAYLGIAQLKADQREEAAYFIEAARVNGRGSFAFDYLSEIAQLLLARGEIERAGEFYEKALATPRDFSDIPALRGPAILNLALIRIHQDRMSDARRWMEALTGVAPALTNAVCSSEGREKLAEPPFSPDDWLMARRSLCEQVR